MNDERDGIRRGVLEEGVHTPRRNASVGVGAAPSAGDDVCDGGVQDCSRLILMKWSGELDTFLDTGFVPA